MIDSTLRVVVMVLGLCYVLWITHTHFQIQRIKQRLKEVET